MFMAILNDTYSEVKEEVENRKEDFQMLDFLKRGYNNVREVISERDKLLDIQTTVKLAADDGVVTFDEIRENLRKLNFSDAEIGNVQFFIHFMTVLYTRWRFAEKNHEKFVKICLYFNLTRFFTKNSKLQF